MIYYKIVLPLCKPALASAAVFTFMANWNDFMAPLIYLRTESKFTLQLGMLIFRSQSEVYWNHLMAVSVLALAPCLVIFFLVQRWFIEGIALTGIKG
jgi:multiple sugar transport system permease protein